MRAFLLSAMLCPWGLTHAQDIVRGEYWVDTDPGFGTAIAFDPALIPAPDVLPTTIIVDLSGYEPGFHVIGFRTQDALLQWSLTNLRSVVVVDSTQGQVVEIEYFWDTESRIRTLKFGYCACEPCSGMGGHGCCRHSMGNYTMDRPLLVHAFKG